MKRNQDGYTLVELLVTIAVGSLVTLAATTVLLLGLRINNRSTKTVIRQNTARVVVTMLENLAAEGEISQIKYDAAMWAVLDADNKTLVSYNSADQTIYTGNGENKSSLLEGVTASHVTLSDNGVLTFSMEKDEVNYNTSVYCRTAVSDQQKNNNGEEVKSETDQAIEDANKENAVSGEVGRTAFLNVLASQYRLKGGSPNPGLILNNQLSTGVYYSEWYLGTPYPNDSGWGPETPWCACFVSYGLCHDSVKEYTKNHPNTRGIIYANVDEFVKYFKGLDSGHWLDSTAIPNPGDIIFFDWSGERTDPAHVGVVLEVEKDESDNALKSVTTIEGNSAGIVAVCKYTVGENYDAVMGYGVINWKTDEELSAS